MTYSYLTYGCGKDARPVLGMPADGRYIGLSHEFHFRYSGEQKSNDSRSA
jgi:hypothetical protein